MTGEDTREPGYCVVCGGFHLLTPIPGRSRGVCGSPSCRQQLEPPEPYAPGLHHLCGVGGAPKPDHPRYRQCRCGQWYWWSGSLWCKVARPPQHWLHEHGLDAAEFWDLGDDEEPRSPFGEFFTAAGGWRYVLWRLLLRLRRD